MHAERLLRDCLAAALRAAGQGADEGDAVALAARWVATSGPGIQARAELSRALKLRPPEIDALRAELQRWLAEHAAAGPGAAPRNLQLAELRCLLWFETAQASGAPAALPRPEPARQDHLSAFRFLRALELMMRALLEETHPDAADLEMRLRELFPAEYREAMRRGQGQPLNGLFLKDLIRLFVDPAEWARLGRLFEPSRFLSLLREKRLTAGSFLEDLRRIRNAVAHLGTLSAVQVELLGLYYEELVEPVRDAFQSGATRVDPGRFESADPAALRTYGDTVRAEVARESRLTRRVAWASLVVTLVLAAAALPLLLPALRLRLDRDLEYTDADERNPADRGSLALQACESGRVTALTRLAGRPGAATAMAGFDAEALHARVVELAAHDPARLLPCVASLHAMGWNANRIGGNRVGMLFAGGEAPAGYRSYLAAYPRGLLGSTTLDATQLRAPVLMLAVWHGDAALARALAAAGASATAHAVVDGLAVGRNADLPVVDSLTEARRIGDAAVIAAMQH